MLKTDIPIPYLVGLSKDIYHQEILPMSYLSRID